MLLRAAGLTATIAAAALAVMLGVRRISSYDVGYHLAYGDHFLQTGEIVQTNRFMYTALRGDVLADPKNLGPGCRYDAETGAYHFVNANWLSQVIMAAAHRAGGFGALWALQSALVAALVALAIVTMRRHRVGWHWVAPAVVLAAMTAYERFSLRPEVFGYLMLLGQWCLLSGPRFGWRSAAGVIGLQLLAVNLHSYFLLGIALSGAMLADGVARWLWARVVKLEGARPAARRIRWLAVATGGVVLACLCNPWHVRGAVMPIQTLLFVKEHNIAALTESPQTIHPWAVIGEFSSPLAKLLAGTRATKAYIVLLCVTGATGLVALLRGRVGFLAVLAGMTAISLNMRRNIAPAAMILAPLSAIVLADGWRRLREAIRAPGAPLAGRIPPDLLRRVPLGVGLGVAAATILLSAWWAVGVATQRFYFSERRSWRFGSALSQIAIPLSAADWINEHAPKGKVFCDYDTSSNLMYLTRPRREVPVLTNTWAYPPYVMEWVLQCAAGQRSFEPVVADYGVTTVVLRSSHVNRPLMAALSKSPRWAVVDLGVKHVVFVRRDGPDAELAAKHEITKKSFDVQEHVERVSASDSVPAFALHNTAVMLFQLDWGEPALRVWRRVVKLRPDYFEALGNLGLCLCMRGTSMLLLMQAHLARDQRDEAERCRDKAIADWAEARQLLQDALRVDPDYQPARKNLKLLNDQIEALSQGKILLPRAPLPSQPEAAEPPGRP